MSTTLSSPGEYLRSASGRITVQIAVSSVEFGACLVAMVLLMMSWTKHEVYKRTIQSCAVYLILGLTLSLVIGSALAITLEPSSGNSDEKDFHGMFSTLMIATLATFAAILALDIGAIILSYAYTYRDSSKEIKRYSIHVVVIGMALLASAAVAIWTVVVGQELRDLISFWTWEVFAIAFGASLVGFPLLAAFIYCSCMKKCAGRAV